MIDARDFGVSGDGSLQSEQLKNALNACGTESAGQWLLLPPGVIRIDRPIVIFRGVQIRGEGRGDARNTQIVYNGLLPLLSSSGSPVLVNGEEIHAAIVFIGYELGQTLGIGRADMAYLP